MSTVDRIALVGLPGSGKSSVATALAHRLGWASVDLDDEVEAAAGRPVPVLLRDEGEAAFRRLEANALRGALAGHERVVIACGGGLVTQAATRDLLLGSACVVWLDAADGVLLQRLGDGSGRPLLDGDPATALPRLRSGRAAAYALSHLHGDAAAPPDQTAARLAAALDGTLRVNVPGRGYHVEVRPGALADIDLHLPATATRVALIADRRLGPAVKALAATIRRSGATVTVIGLTGGEPLKTWSMAGRLLQRLSRAGLRRGDCVVALGGGALGDVAGFVAATYLRGVAWINVPTTLLAMVDSAIGGKTGVNLPRGKNLAGAVWQPRAVICDTDLLASLAERPYRSAFAEIVKYCMISEDGLVKLMGQDLDLLLRRDATAVAAAVRHCVAVKAEVVAADERESGMRAVLNYGHTIGHALEAATGYDAVNHGEAIAVGMRAAGRLSVRLAGCPEGDIAWQDDLLRRCGLGSVPAFDPTRVLKHIGADKKATATGVGWVLLERRGHPVHGRAVPDDLVCEVLREVAA